MFFFMAQPIVWALLDGVSLDYPQQNYLADKVGLLCLLGVVEDSTLSERAGKLNVYFQCMFEDFSDSG